MPPVRPTRCLWTKRLLLLADRASGQAPFSAEYDSMLHAQAYRQRPVSTLDSRCREREKQRTDFFVTERVEDLLAGRLPETGVAPSSDAPFASARQGGGFDDHGRKGLGIDGSSRSPMGRR